MIQLSNPLPGVQQGEALVSADLTEREKNQLASLLRKIIRSAEDDQGDSVQDHQDDPAERE